MSTKIPIRNVVLLGHSHSGKTQLAEALLVAGGAIVKPGKVTEGTTVSDYNSDERERKLSINLALLHFEKDGIKINLIDVPGYGDFIGEELIALSAADSAVVVINAVNGVEMGTKKALKLIKERDIPAVIFVNRLDKENADFDKCVEGLQERLGKKCAVVSYPIGREADIKDVVDLVTKEHLSELEGDEKVKAEKLKETLVENVAACDDVLIEEYLEKGNLPEEKIKPALKKAFLEKEIIPILAGSAMLNIGVKELICWILEDLPSPEEAPPKDAMDPKTGEKIFIDAASNFFSAQVFKTISDPYVGQISVLKIFSGEVSSNTSFYNSSRLHAEKSGQLFMLQGKEHKQVTTAKAGDIVACVKLKDTFTGDSLSTEKNPVVFEKLKFPEPTISFSIKPKTRSDEDKISTALHKLTAEDIAFKAERDAQTKELVVSGMGDLHVKIMMKRLKARFGVDVDMGTPKVAYREAIMSNGDSHYKHKKQSGGAGQFAEVWVRVEPLPRGTGFEFVNKIVGGAIPAPFIASCEKGIKIAMQDGPLGGFPLVDVRATVYDGKTHPVDSKDIAFQIAAKHCFKDAVMKAKPVFLEPIMNVDVTIPDEVMGDITGSLNSRRGRIMGIDPGIDVQTIKSKVPLEEMYKWVNELKSITGGRGTYAMRFSHYEAVPSNLVNAIAEKAKKAKEEARA